MVIISEYVNQSRKVSAFGLVFEDAFRRRWQNILLANAISLILLAAAAFATGYRATIIVVGLLTNLASSFAPLGDEPELRIIKTLPVPDRQFGAAWWSLALPATTGLPTVLVSIIAMVQFLSMGRLTDPTKSAVLYMALVLIAVNSPMAFSAFAKHKLAQIENQSSQRLLWYTRFGCVLSLAVLPFFWAAIKIVAAGSYPLQLFLLVPVAMFMSAYTFVRRQYLTRTIPDRANTLEQVVPFERDEALGAPQRTRISGLARELILYELWIVISVTVIGGFYFVIRSFFGTSYIPLAKWPVVELLFPTMVATFFWQYSLELPMRIYRTLPLKTWVLSLFLTGLSSVFIALYFSMYGLVAIVKGLPVNMPVFAMFFYWSGLAGVGSVFLLIEIKHKASRALALVLPYTAFAFLPLVLLRKNPESHALLLALCLAGLIFHVLGPVLVRRVLTRSSSCYRERKG